MARVRMVTRTVNEVTCEVMCMDTTNGTVVTKEFTLSGEHTEETALKTLKKSEEKDGLVLGKIITMKTEEVLYGIEEVEFLKVARKLPPRTGKETE